MPLPSTEFSLKDVRDEFGSNTLPSTHRLTNFYTAVFGSVSNGDTLSEFGNTGQPSISNVSTSSSNTSSIDVSFSYNRRNLTLSYNISASSQDSSDTANVSGTRTSGTSLSRTLSSLNAGETYNITILYWNGFNSHSSDRGTHTTTQRVEKEQHDTPTIDDFSILYSPVYSSKIDLSARFNYDDQPSSLSDWRMDYEYNSSVMTGQQANVYRSNGNIGETSNPKIIYGTGDSHFDISNLSEGDFFRIRIRAEESHGFSQSDYSNVVQSEVRALAPPDIENIQQRDEEDNDTRVRVWLDHNEFGENTEFVAQWEVNGSIQHTDTINGGTTNITRNFNDGDSVRVRARYNEGQDQSYGSWSSTVVVDIEPAEPQNVSLTNPSGTSYNLSWDSPESGYTFDVEFDSGSGWETFVSDTSSTSYSGDACGFTETSSVSLQFRVRSIEGNQTSDCVDSDPIAVQGCSTDDDDDDGGGTGPGDPDFE